MEFLVIALLILLNGLFVAAEFSLVRVRRTRIEQLVDEGSRGARRVERLVSQPGRFLAVIQIGVTFVGSSAAFAGVSIVDDLARTQDACRFRRRRS
jgi:putative hemolysin